MRTAQKLSHALLARSVIEARSLVGAHRDAIHWCIVAVLFSLSAQIDAGAETLPDALAKAYVNNPRLNAERAAVRAADEAVPIAAADSRPQASATLDAGLADVGAVGVRVGDAFTASMAGSAGASRGSGRTSRRSTNVLSAPRGIAVNVEQTLFDGLRTRTRIRAAETEVLEQREALRLIEQSVLQEGAQAYVDVLRDTAVLGLRRQDVQLFTVRLMEARDRLAVGDVTPTDMAAVEARFAGSQAAYSAAEAALQNSIASFRQVIGELPAQLAPARPALRELPVSLEQAIAISQLEHPSIQQALFQIDRAALQVNRAEGALFPTIGLHGGADRHDDANGVPGNDTLVATADLHVGVPIYDGAAGSANVRLAKEQLGSLEAEARSKRDEVRAAVVSAWGVLMSSQAAIRASRLEIQADEAVVVGMREERRVGQRTMLDVLDAQQALLRARISLVRSQRDEIVGSYAVLASTGRLSASTAGLTVPSYDPRRHFDQVKDKWFGLRTPDGR